MARFKQITDNDHITVKELADILGLKEQTIRDKRHSKTLEVDAVIVGKRSVRFRWGDVKKAYPSIKDD